MRRTQFKWMGGIQAALLVTAIVILGPRAMGGPEAPGTAAPTASPSPTEAPGSTPTPSVSPTVTTGDILSIVRADGRFNTLVQAIEAAGLGDELSGTGPFTVFAPTDQAFAQLPAGVLTSLLSNPDQLSQLLQYHVVSGRLESGSLSTQTVTALNGETLQIQVSGGTVQVNDATVIQADIPASNGVIHAIDTVLTLPQAEPTSTPTPTPTLTP